MNKYLIKRVVSILLIIFSIINIVCFTSCKKESVSDSKIITDCSGAKVEISKNIKTVIAPNQPFCEFMIAMGEADKLIGSHGSVLGHSWAPIFYENITSLEMYGYKPEAETLLAAGADLVVVKNPAYAETLRKAGIPAIYFGYNNIDELYYAVDLMGEIFGDNAKNFANKWKNKLNGTIDSISKEVSSIDEADKKSVYFMNAAINPCSLYSTFGGDSFTNYWIDTIGGKLVTSEYENIEEIDQEVAISLNPEVIFISGYAEYTSYDELMGDKLWSDIDAVKNKEVYLMPTSLVSFDRFAVELPMLLEYSANLLYPELHKFNALDEMRSFYKEFYGKDFTDEQLNYMIKGLNPDGSRMG